MTSHDGPSSGRPLSARRRTQAVSGGAVALAIFGAVLIAGIWLDIAVRVRIEPD